MTLVLAGVMLALVLPWGAAAAARRLAALLPPREACAALTGAALLLAVGTVAALIGLFHVPFLAALEQVPLPRAAAEWPATVPVAAAAGVALALQTVLVVRRWHEHRSVLARAWSATGDAVPDGDLLVVPGPDPQAFALPGWRGRSGRIVVTTGMIRALGPAEREVLFGHERAHLAGRHHLLSVTAYLAAAVHPALRSLRPALDLHLERWADETAASSVGNRRLAATAIARAALAAASTGQPGKGHGPLLSVGSGPVPQRVEALLRPAPVRPRARGAQAAAVGLATAVAVSAVLALGLAYGLHEYVELTARALLSR
ncbi:M56 family metallopeptidase [Streptomyces sp. CJ_13]|uniref:M56 family metallopeptidase n=1 Tax=Streptomyces TaxID=1883 RepID=UPI000F3A9724|nr:MULTISPECIES: M56 family metallopeptidase [unclassified Streptomyces]AYV31922.1 heat shock protein HtpX [Streptomyces sp. ADI95-16]MBT1185879.1 M56 family metallopeptidase [Streptomyces sp. CJ_13]